MILQSLYSLYGRLATDPDNNLPLTGYSIQNISFCILIKPDGELVEIQPIEAESIQLGKNGKEKKTTRPARLLMPGQAKPPGSGFNPCFLWDNTSYLLGYKADDENTDRTANSFEKFKKKHLDLEQKINSQAFSSVCRFLEKWKPEHLNFASRFQSEDKKIDELKKAKAQEEDEKEVDSLEKQIQEQTVLLEKLREDAEDKKINLNTTIKQLIALQQIKTGFGVFQVTDSLKYVHDDQTIKQYWENQLTPRPSANVDDFCLITGTRAPTASIHDPAIKGVTGAQSSGAKLVSFNLGAFKSFAKEQGANSPVSEEATFAYCNALNFLLEQRSRRFRLGDATCVFWTDAKCAAEEVFSWMMSGIPEGEDEATKQRIERALKHISQGHLTQEDFGDVSTKFYILALSPNASRLSVRFWLTGTLGELGDQLKKHFQDLSIVRQWDESNSLKPQSPYPSAYQLMRESARDVDGISPLLSGALMKSILQGGRYPDTLINGVMNRIRVVEKNQHGEGSRDNVSYLRASILKAWLIRNHNQTITPMLDITNNNVGYKLGRLFAVLEKTQQDALPGINVTIRDRFYSSASATPRTVFGRLLRLSQHHLGKLSIGTKIDREKLSQEILHGVSDMPAFLNLQNQAQFALGYYHQRKDFFTKKETVTAENQTQESNQ